ncbi:MAG: four helix bundle protein [bacterium]|nr:four helix bundle protein [bacterium]
MEVIEAIAIAGFLSPEDKQPWIRVAIRKVETLKILLIILWETKSLDDKKFIALSVPMDEIGRLLGGWNGQVMKALQKIQHKQNSPNKS